MRHFYAAVTAGALSILGCNAAIAQSGPPGVRLYGVLDAFVESAHTGTGTMVRLGSGGIFSTRFGIAGTEDLGGGLKAGFVLESLFNINNGSIGSGGTFWGRTSTVGIESAQLGKVEFGRMATEINESLSTFYMARYGAGNFIFNPVATMTHNNGIKYTSPTFGPVVLTAHYDFGQTANSLRTNSAYSVMGTYRSGPVLGLLGYFKSFAPLDFSKAGDSIASVTAGASYDFGPVRPAVLVQTTKSNIEPRAVDQYMLNFGAEVPLGRGVLRLEYELFRNKAATNSNANAVSARYDYFLSKRTTIYAGAVKIRNDANIYFPIVGASGSAPIAFPIAASYKGTDPSSLILGISHAF